MPRITQPLNQLKLTNVAIVRYRDKLNVFELACYPNKVIDWREGRESDIQQVLQSHRIFSNVIKGQFASTFDLQNTFGTSDWEVVSKFILKNGLVQKTHSERMQEQHQFIQDVLLMCASKIRSCNSNNYLSVKQLENVLKENNLRIKPSSTVSPKAIAKKICLQLAAKQPDLYYLPGIHVKIFLNTIPNAKREQFEEQLTKEVLDVISLISFSRVEDVIEFYTYESEKNLLSSFFAANKNAQLDSITIIVEKIPYQSIKDKIETTKAENLAKQRVKTKVKAENEEQVSDDSDSDESLEELTEDQKLQMTRQEIKQYEKLRLKRLKKLEQAQMELENAFKAEEDHKNEPEQNTIKNTKPRANEALSVSNSHCSVCDSGISSLKSHIKSNWHVYNVKRKFKQLNPVSEEMFNEMYDDIKNNFHAIDYD